MVMESPSLVRVSSAPSSVKEIRSEPAVTLKNRESISAMEELNSVEKVVPSAVSLGHVLKRGLHDVLVCAAAYAASERRRVDRMKRDIVVDIRNAVV